MSAVEATEGSKGPRFFIGKLGDQFEKDFERILKSEGSLNVNTIPPGSYLFLIRGGSSLSVSMLRFAERNPKGKSDDYQTIYVGDLTLLLLEEERFPAHINITKRLWRTRFIDLDINLIWHLYQITQMGSSGLMEFSLNNAFPSKGSLQDIFSEQNLRRVFVVTTAYFNKEKSDLFELLSNGDIIIEIGSNGITSAYKFHKKKDSYLLAQNDIFSWTNDALSNLSPTDSQRLQIADSSKLFISTIEQTLQKQGSFQLNHLGELVGLLSIPLTDISWPDERSFLEEEVSINTGKDKKTKTDYPDFKEGEVESLKSTSKSFSQEELESDKPVDETEALTGYPQIATGDENQFIPTPLRLPNYNPPAGHRDIEDQLNFQDDIDSFAALIAYEKTQPPLAIGLFGHWGSGKSFFMEHLAKEVELLSRCGTEGYCQNVVQVPFNSWHYADANLWASIVTEIFEQLDRYARSKKNGKREYDNFLYLKNELDWREKAAHIGKLDKRIKELKAAEEQEEEEILKNKFPHLHQELMTRIQNHFMNPTLNEEIAPLRKLLGKEITDNVAQMKSMFNNPEFSGGRMNTIRYDLKRFRKPAIIFAILALAIFLAVTVYSDEINQIMHWSKTMIYTLTTLLSGSMMLIWPVIIPLYRRIVGKPRVEALKAQWEEVSKKEIKNLVDKAIQELKEEKKGFQKELDDIRTGKKLAAFINEKANATKYRDHLGLVSWVRKDLEELDMLMKRQGAFKERLLEANSWITGDRELDQNDIVEEEVLKLDRIVLYIDDLDRCPEDRVVEVLEAVHLLLAFELFVVVVGVDPRWVSRALEKKYPDQMQPENPEVVEESEGIFEGTATSFDYLEKIFQIPFALKPMTPDTTQDLIHSLTKDEAALTLPLPILNASESEEEPAFFVKEEEMIEEELVEENGIEREDVEEEMPAEALEEHDFEAREESEEEEVSETELPPQLQLGEKEIAFMKELAPLIGSSPRTVKRYINVYRMLRSKTGFSSIDAPKTREIGDYRLILFLLALVVAHPVKALALKDHTAPLPKNLGEALDKLPAELANLPLPESLMKDIREIPMDNFHRAFNRVARFSFRLMGLEVAPEVVGN